VSRLALSEPVPRGLWIAGAVALVFFLAAPSFLSNFHIRLLHQVFLFGGMAVAWSLLGGFTNYWSFGHTGFVGLGAFAAGLLEARLDSEMEPALRMLLGMGFATLVTVAVAIAIALPVLRLRGIYFAIAMLAFAEIFGEASKAFDVFQGAMGMTLLPVTLFGLDKARTFYFLLLSFFIVTAAVFLLVRRSRLGAGLMCIGQDEDVAAMLGVPTERYKLTAFVLSAVLASIGGVLLAHNLGFFATGSVFRMDISLNMILFTMLGGMGTVLGPFLGALVIILVTQWLLGGMLDLHMLVVGAILIAIVLAAPQGIVGLVKKHAARRRRPHAAARRQSEVARPELAP
jgi:branched-chain amino acid transport system permease protein